LRFSGNVKLNTITSTLSAYGINIGNGGTISTIGTNSNDSLILNSNVTLANPITPSYLLPVANTTQIGYISYVNTGKVTLTNLSTTAGQTFATITPPGNTGIWQVTGTAFICGSSTNGTDYFSLGVSTSQTEFYDAGLGGSSIFSSGSQLSTWVATCPNPSYFAPMIFSVPVAGSGSAYAWSYSFIVNRSSLASGLYLVCLPNSGSGNTRYFNNSTTFTRLA